MNLTAFWFILPVWFLRKQEKKEKMWVCLVGFEILHFEFVWLLRKCGKGKDILVVPG